METTIEKMVMEYPIAVQLDSGSTINVSATREVIEAYGSVNELVNQMVKPLEHVSRIEVVLYSEEMEDVITEVTHDKELEAWRASGERVVITYEFYGIEEEERGYIDRRDGWLPCYTLRKLPQAKKQHSLITDEIKRIASAQLVNQEARNQRTLDHYYKNVDEENRKRMERYYKDHEENKKRNAEAGKRWRDNQKRYGMA